MGCCGQTVFDKLATNEELDKEAEGRELAEYADEVKERGEFGPEGGKLSEADFDEARAEIKVEETKVLTVNQKVDVVTGAFIGVSINRIG